MLETFTNYVKNYDITDVAIKRKYNHSLRVMKLMEEYATKLNWKNDDILLAKEIGLLHDIGRFEQWKIYHSFDDYKTVDHATYSTHELFNNHVIDTFNINPNHYSVIKFAIDNHNKIKIKNNNEYYIKFAKLIRDCDKIDIIYMIAITKELKFNITQNKISDDIINSIKRYELCDRSKIKNVNDRICSFIAFIFDMNYLCCLEQLNKYMDIILDLYKDIYPLQEVNKIIKKFQKERNL